MPNVSQLRPALVPSDDHEDLQPRLLDGLDNRKALARRRGLPKQNHPVRFEDCRRWPNRVARHLGRGRWIFTIRAGQRSGHTRAEFLVVELAGGGTRRIEMQHLDRVRREAWEQFAAVAVVALVD